MVGQTKGGLDAGCPLIQCCCCKQQTLSGNAVLSNEHWEATPETFLHFIICNFIDDNDEAGNPLNETGCMVKATPQDPVIVLVDWHDSHCLDDNLLDFCGSTACTFFSIPPTAST